MANKIQIKRGLKSKLPVLSDGEFGLCTDTKEVFIGSGGENIDVTKSSQLAEVDKYARGFENFRLNGGDILGSIGTPNINIVGLGLIKDIVSYLKTNIVDNRMSIKVTDGNGVGLFERDNTIYLFFSQDIGSSGSYIFGQVLKNNGAFGSHIATVYHSATLTLGAKNSVGTQVINGGTPGNIRTVAIGFTWA